MARDLFASNSMDCEGADYRAFIQETMHVLYDPSGCASTGMYHQRMHITTAMHDSLQVDNPVLQPQGT